ncbi:MAG: MucR family transcriptional regulator [Rhodospirillales bacterium]|nr:MucR family transcriptional regulator [Rhodospirillales bacterium]
MSDSDSRDVDRGEILRMAVEVVSSYVGRNQIAGDQIPELINTVYRSMAGLANPDGREDQEVSKPAVAVRRSITPDYIICLEDGKRLKMLKRHLRTTYGMTPEEYRAKWKLPHDYPMVAPNYAKQRSEFAKNIGLGRKSGRPKSRKSA